MTKWKSSPRLSDCTRIFGYATSLPIFMLWSVRREPVVILRVFVILLQLCLFFLFFAVIFPTGLHFYWWNALLLLLLLFYFQPIIACRPLFSRKPNDFCLDVKRIWEMTATLTLWPRLSGRKGSCALSLEYDGLELVALLMLQFNM